MPRPSAAHPPHPAPLNRLPGPPGGGLLRTLLPLAAAALWPGLLAAESLWQAEALADGTLYSDQVARKTGDLITILVKETTAVTDTQKTERRRQNDIGSLVNMVPASAATAPIVGQTTTNSLPGIQLDSDKHFQGMGTYDSGSDVRATITGRVLDVLDNGNLVIEGRRSIKVNEDTKVILITGIIRTADIHSDNTVMSEKLHDFHVSIEGDGPLNRAQQEGFLGKVLDVIWPF